MRLLKILFFLVIILTIGAVLVIRQATTVPLPLDNERLEFTVPGGSGLNSAAEIMSAAGAGVPAWQLALLGRVMGRATQIKAGSYEVHRGVTPVGLIDMLTRGDVSLGRLTLVEGKTVSEFRAMLNAHPDLTHDSASLSDAQLAARLGMAGTSLEGRFAPETYLFDKQSSDLEVLRRAHAAQARAIAAAWQERNPDLPLRSPDELLVLASMIEKETGLASDRPTIASVFANRLRIGMLMQSDPTVIYGLGARFDGNLRRVDLQTDTPWNTYTRGGLPPTAICLPGVMALRAASNPPKTSFLYFVARGDGSSAFSETLDAHNRAVNQHQRRASR
ncbi:MAG: endolytic transglycosylase MltG [Rhodocyclaceae bacterium]|nr:endolytic transglycosylase MltG [Rhodocyclaceae bacterium]